MKASQSLIIVFGELQTRYFRLSALTNDQCRGNQEGHQTDGDRE
jgi:hypothetical protein